MMLVQKLKNQTIPVEGSDSQGEKGRSFYLYWYSDSDFSSMWNTRYSLYLKSEKKLERFFFVTREDLVLRSVRISARFIKDFGLFIQRV